MIGSQHGVELSMQQVSKHRSPGEIEDVIGTSTSLVRLVGLSRVATAAVVWMWEKLHHTSCTGFRDGSFSRRSNDYIRDLVPLPLSAE